jgi:hypothetical protein
MPSKFTPGWLERAMNGDYTGIDVADSKKAPPKPPPARAQMKKKRKKKPKQPGLGLFGRARGALKNRDKQIQSAVDEALGRKRK